MAGDWFTESFRSEYERAEAAIGRFNLAIFGKTGVGKSTLINAVFGSEVARTGIGEPVTRGSHLYLGRNGQLGIIDTQGLEIGRDTKTIIADLATAVREMRRQELHTQIHVVWYCVRGMDRRFEDTEAEFVTKLDALGLPVIMVVTQVPMREGHYHPDAVALAEMIISRGLPIAGGRPFLVQAREDPFTGQPPHGLRELLDATFRVAPEGVHGALAAVQEVDAERKAKEALRHITVAAGSAAAAAASPIPFSDATLLIPIQLGMMARIAHIYKLPFDRAALLAVASTTAATSAGRAAFAQLLKMVPGAGTVAGGVVGAGVASTFTYAMGQAWLVVCQRVHGGALRGLGGVLDQQAVREAFAAEFKRRVGAGRKDVQRPSS